MADIEILSIPAPIPNRINEDAWLALEFVEPPGYIIAAVIDGAGARLTLPLLETALEQTYHGLSAAAFAASRVRTSLIDQFNNQPDLSLRTSLLTANNALRNAVSAIIGDFSPKHILAMTDGLSAYDDPRRIRLGLPACVVTLVRLNYSDRQLEYAHLGDTALLEIRHNDEVICHTTDQMGPYDQDVLRQAQRLQQTEGLSHFVDAVRLPDIQHRNIENGLRHNYVDERGYTRPGEGCGIVDGLPELADYIESGVLVIDPEKTAGFCVLSDGLQLLAPLEETAAEMNERLQRMGNLLKYQGLSGLFDELKRMIASDVHFDRYPRMKMQDDATGVYLRISDKR